MNKFRAKRGTKNLQLIPDKAILGANKLNVWKCTV